MLPFLDSHVGALPEKQIEHVGGQTWDVKSPHQKASVGHYQSEVKGLFIPWGQSTKSESKAFREVFLLYSMHDGMVNVSPVPSLVLR